MLPPGQRHSSRWPFPVAVFELENSLSDDRVAYSLALMLSRLMLLLVKGIHLVGHFLLLFLN